MAIFLSLLILKHVRKKTTQLVSQRKFFEGKQRGKLPPAYGPSERHPLATLTLYTLTKMWGEPLPRLF